MKYTKPEIAGIADALEAVCATNPKAGMTSDSDGGHLTGSAYESDE